MDSKPKLIKKADAKPQPEPRPERPAEFRTALLSCAAKLQSPELEAQVRRAFPGVRIQTFADFEATAQDWRRNLKRHIGTLDGVIVICDGSRAVRGGVLKELAAAWWLNRVIRVFNTETGRIERYAGFKMDPPPAPGKKSLSATLTIWQDLRPARPRSEGKPNRTQEKRPAA